LQTARRKETNPRRRAEVAAHATALRAAINGHAQLFGYGAPDPDLEAAEARRLEGEMKDLYEAGVDRDMSLAEEMAWEHRLKEGLSEVLAQTGSGRALLGAQIAASMRATPEAMENLARAFALRSPRHAARSAQTRLAIEGAAGRLLELTSVAEEMARLHAQISEVEDRMASACAGEHQELEGRFRDAHRRFHRANGTLPQSWMPNCPPAPEESEDPHAAAFEAMQGLGFRPEDF
jgi:hypothetical protein